MNKVSLDDVLMPRDVEFYNEKAEWLQTTLNQDCPLIRWRVLKSKDKKPYQIEDSFTVYGHVMANNASLNVRFDISLRELDLTRDIILDRVKQQACYALARLMLRTGE